MAKKVLWVSAQPMTDAQLVELQWLFGAEGEVEVKNCSEPISDWQDVVNAGDDCDVLAVDLPDSILPDDEFFDYDEKYVIRPKKDDRACWQQILGVETTKVAYISDL